MGLFVLLMVDFQAVSFVSALLFEECHPRLFGYHPTHRPATFYLTVKSTKDEMEFYTVNERRISSWGN